MFIAFPFLVLLLIAGLFLLITGVRGYRIGDHPVCQRCGFDLFGLPSGVSICSECGSDVLQPNSIRIGHRERQPGSILFGVLFLLTFAIVACFAGWEATQNINWEEQLPTFWLIHESASNNPASRDPALAELLRRLQAGLLSDREMQKLVVRALAIQADTTKAWVTAWGDIAESANNAGKMTNEQWTQYVRNAPDPQLAARPRVRRGDVGVPLRLSEGLGRVGHTSTLCIEIDGEDNGSDLASANQRGLFGGSSGLSSGGSGSSSTSLILDPALVANAPLGQKLARIKLKLRLFPTFHYPQTPGVPIAERTIVLQAPWELFAADAATVQPINDDKYRAAVAKCLKVGQCRISGTAPNTFCQVEITCSGSPVPLAYDVFVRANGRDVPAGSVTFPAAPTGNLNEDYSTGQSAPDLKVGHVDIILKPSENVCASTIDMTSYWNGQIKIANVPLTHH